MRSALRAPPDSPNRGCYAAYPRLCSPLSSTLGVKECFVFCFRHNTHTQQRQCVRCKIPRFPFSYQYAVLFAAVFCVASVSLQFGASLRQHCAGCCLRCSLGKYSAACGEAAVNPAANHTPNKSLKLTASNGAASQFAPFSVPSALRASAAA